MHVRRPGGSSSAWVSLIRGGMYAFELVMRSEAGASSCGATLYANGPAVSIGARADHHRNQTGHRAAVRLGHDLPGGLVNELRLAMQFEEHP